MSLLSAPLAAGLTAGLAVAVPLGPVGLLLVREGMLRGWRASSAGAAGVAITDLVYAGLAVAAARPLAAVLAEHHAMVGRIAGAVLLAVAARGLWGARTSSPIRGSRPSRGGSFLRFLALTLVNPATVLFFAVVATGSVATFGSSGTIPFVTGVFAASLTWQLLLAAAGTLAGARVGERAHRWTALAGHALLAAYALHLLLPA
jgi:threonine/homoserine/homoserine lactone efflux protein